MRGHLSDQLREVLVPKSNVRGLIYMSAVLSDISHRTVKHVTKQRVRFFDRHGLSIP